MPPVIPVVAALAAYATATEIAGAVTLAAFGAGIGSFGAAIVAGDIIGGLAGFVVASAIDAVGSRLFAPNKPGPPPAVQNPAIMVRSALETHKIVYGQARTSGPVVFIGTTDTGPNRDGSTGTGDNMFCHVVVALTGHEVDSIPTIYLNDSPVTLDSNGWATSAPYADGFTPLTATVSTAVRTEEVVTVTTSGAHGFSTGDLVSIDGTSDASMDGSFVIVSTGSTTFTYSNGGPNSSATGGTATDETNASPTGSYVRVKKHTGAVGQAADSDLMAEVSGWDSNHMLNGISYVYVRMTYNAKVFGNGIPNVSAVVNGKKVYDPRDSSTAWSANAALCTRDYLTSVYGCQTSEINDTYFSAAANHCDESVTLTTGGSQNRYSCNGVLDTAVDNLNSLVAAMAGAVTYVQGQFRGYAGVYDSTVGDLTTSMLAGPVKVHTRTTRQQLFNAVQGTYIDPALSYQPTDFPPLTNPTYQADDGGQAIYKDIQLPLTNHPEAAQRIAKVILEQGRQGIMVELTLNHTALPFCVFDTVTYTDPNFGWDHKVFRIRKLTATGVGPITVLMQEEASASYDWDDGEATVLDPAPDTNLPDPFTVPNVSGLSFNSRAALTKSGDTMYNLVLSWNQSSDVFVREGGKVEIQYKLSSDTDWRPSFFVNGDLTFSDILESSVNVSYDMRVRAVNSLGASSGWSQLVNCVAGSSGGVSVTNDWGDWTHSPGVTLDWGDWTHSPGSTADWGFFT